MADIHRATTNARGPSSRRGLQFADTTLPELLDTLTKTQARLRLLDALLRSDAPEQTLVEGERPLTRDELVQQRREMVRMQSDLRAELRRRAERAAM